MTEASQKEYDRLQEAVAEIRSSITKYIGFIISTAGISGVILKYLYRNEELDSKGAILILVMVLTIITFLFEIIWYKFKSHNRHVGYLQLLSQEVGYFSVDEEIGKLCANPGCTRASKPYLDAPAKLDVKGDLPTSFNTWEFVMSRLNSANSRYDEKKLDSVLKKVRYRFQLPDNKTYKETLGCCTNFADKLFFKEIVSVIYGNKPIVKLNNFKWKNGLNQNFIEKEKECVMVSFPSSISNNSKKALKRIQRKYLSNQNSIFQSISLFWTKVLSIIMVLPFLRNLLLLLFFDKVINKVRHEHIGFSRSYLQVGWAYPRKILQISFICVCGLFFVIYFIIQSKHPQYLPILPKMEIILFIFFGSTIYIILKKVNQVENKKAIKEWKLITFGLFALYSIIALISIVSHNETLILNLKSSILNFSTLIVMILVATVWIFRYVSGINKIFYGKYSIDAYCWAFFLSRVQLLNSYDVNPIFFSRAYLRYHKKTMLLKNINEETFSDFGAKSGIDENDLKVIKKAYLYYLANNYEFNITILKLCHQEMKKLVKSKLKRNDENSLQIGI